MAGSVPLQPPANGPDVGPPRKCPVKVEHSSSPPSLVEDASGTLEDGEIDEQQGAVGSLRSELQLSTFEYSALEDRFKRLERQHRDLQDLASAYSEVIRGLSAADGQTVSIDQLQAEAGHDGLRAKALEADVLRPLIREAGGLQALISQTHTMRTLTDKAGGLRELERFVSDLRTIRDTLDELKGSQGLSGLVMEVRALLQSKQEQTELKAQLDGPNGLREKAARYEKLVQAFGEVQAITLFQQRDTIAETVDPARALANNSKDPPASYGRPASRPQPSAGPAAMNPARARMISATPLEADPDRDLYEPPPPPAKPNNRTGSNNTPLGPLPSQPTAQPIDLGASSSTLKRKGPEGTSSNIAPKRPRVDLSQASALVQASLPTVVNYPAGRAARQSNATGVCVKDEPRTCSVRVESESTLAGDSRYRPQVQTNEVPPKLPDWMRSNIRFGAVGFTSMPLVQPRTYSPMPGGARQGYARAPTASSGLRSPKLNALTNFFQYPVALWVGASDGYAKTAWDAYQSYDLKGSTQIPDELLKFLLGELAKHVNTGNSSRYKQMTPNGNTCILRSVVDAHKPSGLPQERRACPTCAPAWAGQSRPCALLQDIGGARTMVFLPLHESLRAGARWIDKAYWMRVVQ